MGLSEKNRVVQLDKDGCDAGKSSQPPKRSKQRAKLALVVLFCVSTIALVGCAALSTTPVRAEVPALAATTTTAHYASGAEVEFDMRWTEDSRCASCHEKEVASTTNDCLASKHPDQTCVDCHSDAAVLETAHADLIAALRADPPRKLTAAPLTQQFCIDCHDPATVIPLTEGILEDSEGATFNPHNLSVNEKHATVTCGSCHWMHSEGNIYSISTTLCTTCHHDGTYEACLISCHVPGEV